MENGNGDGHNKMRASTKAGIGLIGILLALPQLRELKEFFLGDQIVTNARIEKSMNEGFARLEDKLDAHIRDEKETHVRIRTLDREDITAAEYRCEKRSDKIEDRLSNLEGHAFKGSSRKGSQN